MNVNGYQIINICFPTMGFKFYLFVYSYLFSCLFIKKQRVSFISFFIAICVKCRKTIQSSSPESSWPEKDFEDIAEHLSALNLVSVFALECQ